jgi:hypothetical protein
MAPPTTNRRPRWYNKEERKTFNHLKADYMKTKTPKQRRDMAQTLIFPPLFTYWSSIGITMTQAEKDAKTEVSK